MITVKKEGILLKKTHQGFENEGVFNPAVIEVDGVIHLFYRAVSKGNYSSIGYCRLKEPLLVEERWDVPVLFPQHDFEVQGVEDPRIVKIDDLFYLSYTAYDGVNALGALALSHDLKTFDKIGIIVPKIAWGEFYHLIHARGSINKKYLRYNKPNQYEADKKHELFVWDKNLVFFPRRLGGKLYFLHRIRPDIQIVSIDRLDELTVEFWQNYFIRMEENIVLSPKYAHEISYIGGGCPPIETDQGWLIIYHSVCDTIGGYVYSASAALLHKENPQIEIARLPYPLFQPDVEWEMKGEVNNVCFPTGTVLRGDNLYIYYGAADEHIACASINLPDLINELISYSITSDKQSSQTTNAQ